jgi:hypothetical protein
MISSPSKSREALAGARPLRNINQALPATLF